MTNEELKKKIKEILRKRMTELLGSCHTDEIPLTEEGAEAILFYADEFADALIAAGIGDVKETEAEANRYEMLYKLQNRDMALAERRAHDAEHRAEVVQLVAKRACDIVFSQELDSEDWDEAIFNYKKEKGIREIGITPNILYDYLKEQAEKELAEEGKE